jgi:tRNA (mo5U34)-methyltransferase
MKVATALRRRVKDLVRFDLPDLLSATRVFPGGGQARLERLRRRLAQVTWFHRIDLGNGIVTPGIDPSADKLKTFGIPESLEGQSVLDIGAWDGFFSFEAERRGARRVLATDSFCWGGGGWGSKAGFNLAHKVLRSRVRSKTIDVLELCPEKIGMFDLVLCLGVLYHMKHPLLALERVFSVTKKQLILETHVDMLDCNRPAMAFYPGDEVGLDPTNWCGPNPQMVVAMLKTVGFQKVEIMGDPVYFTAISPRMVFHAWR